MKKTGGINHVRFPVSDRSARRSRLQLAARLHGLRTCREGREAAGLVDALPGGQLPVHTLRRGSRRETKEEKGGGMKLVR